MLARRANAFRVLDHDLEVAASDKHESHGEWEKGDESDYYGEHDEKKGEKGEKGYDSKHGWVDICWIDSRLIENRSNKKHESHKRIPFACEQSFFPKCIQCQAKVKDIEW